MDKFNQILFDYRLINQLNESEVPDSTEPAAPQPTWDDNQMVDFVAKFQGNDEQGPNYLGALSVLMDDPSLEYALNIEKLNNVYGSLSKSVSNLLNTPLLSGTNINTEEVEAPVDNNIPPEVPQPESPPPEDPNVTNLKNELSNIIPPIKDAFAKIKEMTSDEKLQIAITNLRKLYDEQPDIFNDIYEQSKATTTWKESLSELINKFSQTTKTESFNKFDDNLDTYLTEMGFVKAIGSGLRTFGDDALKWGTTAWKNRRAAKAAATAAAKLVPAGSRAAKAGAATKMIAVGKLTWPGMAMLFGYVFIDKAVSILTSLAGKGIMMPLTILHSCLEILRKYKSLLLKIFVPVQIISGVIIKSGGQAGQFTGPMMQEMLEKIFDFGFDIISELFKIMGLKELTTGVSGLGRNISRNTKTAVAKAMGVGNTH